MAIGTKKPFKLGGSAVIAVGKSNLNKEITFTDELTEEELELMILFKKFLKRLKNE